MEEIGFDLIEELVGETKKAFLKAGELGNKHVETKELNDIVTDVDLFMEKRITSFIEKKFPEHSVYSEEKITDETGSEYQWLIDPIDGTINFVAGIPLFSTSIALKRNEEILLGIVFDWGANNVYYAIRGKGAFCDGEPICVARNKGLKDSIVSFCLTAHYTEKEVERVLDVERRLADKVRGLRLIVSSAIELAWCASGKTDGCINIKPSIRLSSTAGILLVEEAGGKVSNVSGSERARCDTMLATNGLIHDEIVGVLNK